MLIQARSSGPIFSKIPFIYPFGLKRSAYNIQLSYTIKKNQYTTHRMHGHFVAELTFFLYLVVLATAKTPFLIALVHRCCMTTCEGTGKTLLSSVSAGMFSMSSVIALDPLIVPVPEPEGTNVVGRRLLGLIGGVEDATETAAAVAVGVVTAVAAVGVALDIDSGVVIAVMFPDSLSPSASTATVLTGDCSGFSSNPAPLPSSLGGGAGGKFANDGSVGTSALVFSVCRCCCSRCPRSLSLFCSLSLFSSLLLSLFLSLFGLLSRFSPRPTLLGLPWPLPLPLFPLLLVLPGTVILVFKINLSRCLGIPGAGGTLGAGTNPLTRVLRD